MADSPRSSGWPSWLPPPHTLVQQALFVGVPWIVTSAGFRMTGGDWFFAIYFGVLMGAVGLVLWREFRSRPNYAAFKGRTNFRLYEAAALMLEMSPEGPNPAVTSAVHSSQLTLKDAARDGRLKVLDRNGSLLQEPGSRQLSDPYWPGSSVWVPREQLKQYTSGWRRIPRFLRD